jgi:hypothetical protein
MIETMFNYQPHIAHEKEEPTKKELHELNFWSLKVENWKNEVIQKKETIVPKVKKSAKKAEKTVEIEKKVLLNGEKFDSVYDSGLIFESFGFDLAEPTMPIFDIVTDTAISVVDIPLLQYDVLNSAKSILKTHITKDSTLIWDNAVDRCRKIIKAHLESLKKEFLQRESKYEMDILSLNEAVTQRLSTFKIT